MPVHTSIATAIDKTRLASDVVYVGLLEIDVVDRETGTVLETLRLAHNNENYEFRGQTYVKCPFEFSVEKAKNELPKITLEVTDLAQTLQAYLQEHEGAVDFPVRLLVVSTANPDAPEFQEDFTVLTARSNSESYKVEFELGAENPLGLRFPSRLMFRNRCMWRYRSAECGYNGMLPSCDFTRDGPNGCRAHNNEHNFGGFPGIRRRGY